MFHSVSCHTGAMNPQELVQVGKKIAYRRNELRLSQKEVAIVADVSPRTIHNLESGSTWPHASNRIAIERALRWAPGSLDAIKNGGEPTELAEPAETVGVEKPNPASGATDGVGELRQAIRDLDSLPGYVQRVVLDQAVDELPRAIAALDDERRGRLVRYAFALWDEMGGVASPEGADNAGASHGSLNQRGDAGCADHAGDAGEAGVADNSTAAPDTDSGDGVNGPNGDGMHRHGGNGLKGA